MVFQNLWDASRTMLKEKCVPLNAYYIGKNKDRK